MDRGAGDERVSEYIIGVMVAPGRAACALLLAAALSSACATRGLVEPFEYEEELYLGLDGSATMVVNASLPALVALRGLPLDVSSSARVDRGEIRALFEAPGVEVTRVSRPWRRRGRRFLQVRLDVDDIRRLSQVSAFAWSEYRLDRRDGAVVYRQTVGAPARKPVNAGWRGDERIGFRMHLPARIVYHNAPSKQVERGNILSWEQPLRERLAGTPIVMEVRMEGESILYRTLIVFGIAAAAALALLAAAIWWVWRKGRSVGVTVPGSPGAA
jgi:hypothetical protein